MRVRLIGQGAEMKIYMPGIKLNEPEILFTKIEDKMIEDQGK